MSKHILYSFPSRSRPHKFEAVCRCVWELSKDDNYLIVAKIDDDEPYFDQYRFIADSCQANVVYVNGSSLSKVDAINKGISGRDFDILCCLSDDMHFLTPGFDNIIRQHCGPDDFVHFPDGHVNRRLCTMSIMGRQYYERDGYIYHPSYKSLWCDNEAMLVAQRRMRYKWVNQQIFEHQHPAWIGGEKDALLLHTESFHAEDKANFLSRKQRGFPK